MNLTKRQKIGAGVGAAAVLAGILYWRHSAKRSSPSSPSDPNAIDPLTGLPYSQDNSPDPLTGLSYLQEAQQYGSVSAAEAAFSGATSGQGYSAGYGAAYGGTAGYPTSNVGGASTTPNGYATNAQWAQAVSAGLAQLGYDPQAVAAALGAFFAQMQLTADQAAIVQAAEAEFGPPPQGTYAIVTQPSSGGAAGGGTGGSAGGGSPPPAKHGPITVTPVNLKPSNVSTSSAQVTWTAPRIPAGQGPLTGYGVEAYDQAGHVVNGPFDVGTGQLYANIGQLHSKTTYHVNVWCLPAKKGGPHASTTFKTK